MVTWREALRYKFNGHKAGYGPISDGIPTFLGDSEKPSMPAPIGNRVALLDDTIKMRRIA